MRVRRELCAFGVLLAITTPGADAQYATSPHTDKRVHRYVDGGLNVPAGYSSSIAADFRHHFSETTYGYATAGIGAYYTSVSLTQTGFGYILVALPGSTIYLGR